MAIAVVMAALALVQTHEGPARFAYSEIHMGVRIDVTLYASDEDTAARAAKAAYRRYTELDQAMSDYLLDSELNRLCARAGQGPVPVSRDLFLVLQKAQEVSRLSGGAFDATCSPVVRLWRTARQTGKMPDPAALKAALALVGWQNVVLDPSLSTAELKLPGMRLDLGGIAKGYANDEALKAMRAEGVGRAMIEGGGDIGFSGPPPGQLGWAVRVRGLPDTLYLHDCAMSTSGDTEQFVEIAGVRYSHVVDPRTGIGVTNRVQATVIAPRGLDTDPWSTTLCVDPKLISAVPTSFSVRALVAGGSSRSSCGGLAN